MTNLLRFNLFVFCALLISKITNAQIDSNLLNKKVISFTITEKQIDRKQDWEALDTSITKNELYNPLYQKYGIFQDLGNIGSASQSLIFDPNRKIGYKFCQNPWDIYFFKPEDRIYYNTKSPLTDITYVQGRVDLIYLKAKLAVNVTPRWQIGVDYFRLTSQGNFVSQKNGAYYSQVFTYFQSKNGKYALLGNLTWNLGYNQENGGLRSDSAFEALSGSNKTGNVNLRTSENGFKNRSVYLKQYFYYGKTNQIINKTDTFNQFESFGHFSHTFKADEEIYHLTVTNDSFSKIYPDTGVRAFKDSIVSQTISNKLAYTLYSYKKNAERRFLELAVSHQYIHNNMRDSIQVNEKNYNNLMLEGTIEREVMTNYGISFKGYGAYIPIGFNQNDLKLSGNLGFKTPLFRIEGGILNHLYTPDFTFIHFTSNQFSWNNAEFSKINVSNWNVGIETVQFKHNFKLSYHQNILANWVYFNTDATPTQSNKIALVQVLQLEKTFKLWHFYFENKILFQKSTEDYVRLPEMGLILRYYLQEVMFKKALKLQAGFNVFYNTAFYAQAYNPATRGFYLQNNRQIGDYPLLNVFICGEIRHAIIFASYEHLNQDWVSSTGFYSTPSHPLALTAFKVGVRWRMYN